MRRVLLVAVWFALGVLAISPAGAMASWTLSVSDGAAGGIVTFTGGSNPPTSSEFAVEGPAVSPDSKYSYTIALTDGQTATQAQLSEVVISITNLTGGNLPLTTSLTENDFTLPGTLGSNVFVQSNISATSPTGGSGTFVTSFNGTAMPTQSFLIPTSGSSETQTFTRGASYSIEQVTNVTRGGNQTLQTTGTDTVVVVPEPSTIALVCCALLCWACFGWARRVRPVWTPPITPFGV
jgi:hypothetical protein